MRTLKIKCLLRILGKLKIAVSIGVAGVSLVSVPTSLSVVLTKNSQQFFHPITSTSQKLKNLVMEKMDGFEKQLKENYINFGSNVKGNILEAPEKSKEQFQIMESMGSSAFSFIKEYGETVNYYAFSMGQLVKSLAKYLPTILSDTVIEMTQGPDGKYLLSLQKISDMVKNTEMAGLITNLIKVNMEHAQKFAEMSSNDSDGIMKIIKEIDRSNEGITKFLKKVSENAGKIKSSDTFCNSTKLMLDIFVGKDEMEGISKQLSDLKNQIQALETQLQEIMKDTTIDISSFKDQLEKIENNSSSFSDPCSTANKR